jgi:MoxR-like ATPase
MQVVVDYPNHEEELKILALDNDRQRKKPQPPATPLPQQELFAMRAKVAELFLDPKLNRYIVDLIQATRRPEAYDSEMARWCRFGASPRASLALARCARARAWLDGENFVSPGHIQSVAADILRHRLLLSFEAEAEGITSDDLIQRLISLVAIP